MSVYIHNAWFYLGNVVYEAGYSLDGMPVHCTQTFTHSFTPLGNFNIVIHLLVCFWKVGENWRNLQAHRLHNLRIDPEAVTCYTTMLSRYDTATLKVIHSIFYFATVMPVPAQYCPSLLFIVLEALQEVTQVASAPAY